MEWKIESPAELRRIRTSDRTVTQAYLADLAGCSVRTVQYIEKERSSMSPGDQTRFSKALLAMSEKSGESETHRDFENRCRRASEGECRRTAERVLHSQISAWVEEAHSKNRLHLLVMRMEKFGADLRKALGKELDAPGWLRTLLLDEWVRDKTAEIDQLEAQLELIDRGVETELGGKNRLPHKNSVEAQNMRDRFEAKKASMLNLEPTDRELKSFWRKRRWITDCSGELIFYSSDIDLGGLSLNSTPVPYDHYWSAVAYNLGIDRGSEFDDALVLSPRLVSSHVKSRTWMLTVTKAVEFDGGVVEIVALWIEIGFLDGATIGFNSPSRSGVRRFHDRFQIPLQFGEGDEVCYIRLSGVMNSTEHFFSPIHACSVSGDIQRLEGPLTNMTEIDRQFREGVSRQHRPTRTSKSRMER